MQLEGILLKTESNTGKYPGGQADNSIGLTLTLLLAPQAKLVASCKVRVPVG